MAEIKSTMDLIMERTKNLTMTDEEKKKLQLDELRGKVRGWVLHYAEGAREAEDLERDFAGTPDREALLGFVRQEALAIVVPAGKNDRMLALLQSAGADTAAIKARIEAFRQDVQKEAQIRMKDLNLALAAKGIAGPSVLANLEKDPGWKKWVASALETLRAELGRL